MQIVSMLKFGCYLIRVFKKSAQRLFRANRSRRSYELGVMQLSAEVMGVGVWVRVWHTRRGFSC